MDLSREAQAPLAGFLETAPVHCFMYPLNIRKDQNGLQKKNK